MTPMNQRPAIDEETGLPIAQDDAELAPPAPGLPDIPPADPKDIPPDEGDKGSP